MLTTGEVMLFALLKGSLHNEVPQRDCSVHATQEVWHECYDIAARHGVLALAWDGLMLLPKEMHPPKNLKFQWAMNVEKYEAKYERYCRTAAGLMDFFHRNGIAAVQMKGVGLASTYNKPSHREGGDIDIFTYSADTSKLSHDQANKLANELMAKQGIEVDYSHSEKHSNFYFKGIPVENHKWFVNIEVNPKFLTQLNNILFKVLEPQKATLLDGECSIPVPSAGFNTLFLSYHTFQHFGAGLALHHLYDWANHIMRNGIHIPSDITEQAFLRSIAALTHLCNKYLGTDVDISLLPQDYLELSELMLQEMLHPKYKTTVPYRNPVAVLFYKFIRVLHASRLREYTLGSSRWYLLCQSVIWHLRFPATIFNRGEK